MNTCKLWGGRANRNGYGVRTDSRFESTLVHRQVFYCTHGYYPAVVLHTCDNPGCINIHHLVGGTQKENIADMCRKGRQSNGQRLKTHCPQGHEYAGENLYLRPSGGRGCRTCRKAARKRN